MAGAFLDISLDSRLAGARLSELVERLGDLRVPLSDIGEHLLLVTDTRFQQQVAPDGSPWASLSPVTLAKKKGSRILRESGILLVPQRQRRAKINPKRLTILTQAG
ncbi:hypothetical protein EBB56_13385 [Halomonas sp. YLB-10]|uniref:phage virion morphogenesis protein n=1 Tax=Halomonas sp. YLB-10 TaxID=2483111 RepID=UPI000F5D9E1D|nr:phage virion morphogenesis protein [Halomonas sp. YLB-10]RQW70337.1 hypothetical protein EBB56_13385 [Halomonas sp. YLB-10]